jgi:hypothetical protein
MNIERLETYLPAMAAQAAQFCRKQIRPRSTLGSQFEAAALHYEAEVWDARAAECVEHGPATVIFWAQRRLWDFCCPGGAGAGRFPSAHTVGAQMETDIQTKVAREILSIVFGRPTLATAAAMVVGYNNGVADNRKQPYDYIKLRAGKYGYKLIVRDHDGNQLGFSTVANKAELAAWVKQNHNLREAT